MTMHPLRLRTILVVLLVLGLGGSLARPAAAADWSLAPADNHFGPGRQSLRYTLNPGAKLEDGLVVVNSGPGALHLALRAADGSLGAWVRPGQAAMTVAPGKSVEVPFAVTPPRDAKPGDYAGAIVASAGGSEVGLPVRLRVGGALKPSLAIEAVRLRGETVTYTVRNTGNATLTARQAVSVSGPLGRWAKDAGRLAEVPSLLPGATWQGSAPVPGVTPAVRLTATVTLLPLLTDAAGSTTPLNPVKRSGHGWAVPWSLVATLLVALGLLVAALTIRSRRRHRPLRVAR